MVDDNLSVEGSDAVVKVENFPVAEEADENAVAEVGDGAYSDVGTVLEVSLDEEAVSQGELVGGGHSAPAIAHVDGVEDLEDSRIKG